MKKNTNKGCNKTTKPYNCFRGLGTTPFLSSLSRMDIFLQGPEWQVVSTDLRISSSKEPSQASLEYLITTNLGALTMSYTGNNHFYWQNTWFNTDVLRGGLFAMSFKA